KRRAAAIGACKEEIPGMSKKQDSERKHVVVVDDDADILDMLCTLLRSNGYSAAGARDAKTAVSQVKERVPALLLIDYMLPETDGMTTLQRCRAEPGGKQAKAIML